jgi:hypothetical protein
MNGLRVEFVRCRLFLLAIIIHYSTDVFCPSLPREVNASVASFLAIPCPTPALIVVLSGPRPTRLHGSAVILSAFAPAPMASATLVASAVVFAASLVPWAIGTFLSCVINRSYAVAFAFSHWDFGRILSALVPERYHSRRLSQIQVLRLALSHKRNGCGSTDHF